MQSTSDTISAKYLRKRLAQPVEFALLDVREQEEFSREHVLLACCAPLSRLELVAPELVPCRATPVCVMDGEGAVPHGRAARAARVLRELGYTPLLLGGGLHAWKEAGFVTVNGVGALSKGFGEYVEERQHTPRLPPEEIKALLDDAATPSIVIDVRPCVEYQRMNIPGSVNLPGCELVYRFATVVHDPETVVVINCAGRTRSIIGTQTLVNAGIPNKVVALKGGTMNWQLSGFELEYGSTRPVPPLSPQALETARHRAQSVARRYRVRFVEAPVLRQWQEEAHQRTLYVFDVRQPAEYAAGHLPGSRPAQGGQLVQATDEYAAVRNGRFVLVDNDEIRAIMTAHWLGQMGLPEVYVLRGGLFDTAGILAPNGLERGLPIPPAGPETPLLSAQELELSRRTGGLLLLDVGPSNLHRERHIPGAKWLTRAHLPNLGESLPRPRRVVLTAELEAHARFAAHDAARIWPEVSVAALRGGTPAWLGAGLPTESGMPCALCAVDDVWYRPYTDIHASPEAMRGYFDWEFGLVEQINADGCVCFHVEDIS